MTAVETAIAQENPLSIRGALLWGAQVLLQAGIENNRLDAEVLLRHVLDLEKEQLYMNGDAPISAGQEGKFRELVLRRSRREPVAYLSGHKEFWSLDFFVSSAVLIPRPKRAAGGSGGAIHRSACEWIASKGLDIGTGSGAIPYAPGQRASVAAQNSRPGHFPRCFDVAA